MHQSFHIFCKNYFYWISIKSNKRKLCRTIKNKLDVRRNFFNHPIYLTISQIQYGKSLLPFTIHITIRTAGTPYSPCMNNKLVIENSHELCFLNTEFLNKLMPECVCIYNAQIIKIQTSFDFHELYVTHFICVPPLHTH